MQLNPDAEVIDRIAIAVAEQTGVTLPGNKQKKKSDDKGSLALELIDLRRQAGRNFPSSPSPDAQVLSGDSSHSIIDKQERTKRSVHPDEFLSFDEFIRILEVPKHIKDALVKILPDDEETCFCSGKSFWLFGRTGIRHMQQIKVDMKKHTEEQNKKRSKRKRSKRSR